MKCKLCKIRDDLGKSHVIPKSFFLNEGDTHETPLLLTNKQDVYPRKRRTGEYDLKILCKECEKTFDPWDDYAKKLLIDEFDNFQRITEGNDIKAYAKNSYDYDKIKLFCISVLWRAGVSQREFFTNISLGPHEIVLREMILSQNPGDRDDYSVHFCRFKGMADGAPIIMPMGFRTKYGFWYYRIYLGHIYFDIKVDSRKTPHQHGIGEIAAKQPLVVTSMDIMQMNEYRILKKIVNSPLNATVT